MTAELVQLSFDFEPSEPADFEPLEPADFEPLDCVDSLAQPGGVVIALHPHRRQPPASSAYQVRRLDGALALKAPLPYLVAPLEMLEGPEPLAGSPPEAARTAVIVARALLEVLSGWRPANQLSRWTSYSLQEDLERRAPRRPTGARLQLRRVRLSEPAVGIAEVCALADDPVQQRVRVIAMRLEDRQGEWIVTRLQAG